MKTRPSAFLLLPAVALLAGCSQAGRSTGGSFPSDSEARSIRVYVTNRNFMDATLWAVTPGTRNRLGIVTGKKDAVFTVPWDFSQDLRIEIDMLAGSRCITEVLPVDPGDDIELIIDVDMTRSPLCSGGGGQDLS
ncbi:MAG: hypothetical protein ACWGSQ_19115 [Longimicrobiales bacterium]